MHLGSRVSGTARVRVRVMARVRVRVMARLKAGTEISGDG